MRTCPRSTLMDSFTHVPSAHWLTAGHAGLRISRRGDEFFPSVDSTLYPKRTRAPKLTMGGVACHLVVMAGITWPQVEGKSAGRACRL